MKFTERIDDQRIPPERWRIRPESIYEKYQNKEFDKGSAVNFLKYIFLYRDESWGNVKVRNLCLQYIVELSPKDRHLRDFLEEIVVSEYWHHIKVKALYYLNQHYPKLAFSLFNYEWKENYDTFLTYLLKRYRGDVDISFLTEFIQDPILKLYILLRKEGWATGLSIEGREVNLGDTFKIFLLNDMGFKRSVLINEFTQQQILDSPQMFFVWDSRDKSGVVYKFDDRKHSPAIILHQEEDEEYRYYYSITPEFITIFINAITRTFSFKELPLFSLERTHKTFYYLTFEIGDIPLYMKYHLGTYKITKTRS